MTETVAPPAPATDAPKPDVKKDDRKVTFAGDTADAYVGGGIDAADISINTLFPDDGATPKTEQEADAQIVTINSKTTTAASNLLKSASEVVAEKEGEVIQPMKWAMHDLNLSEDVLGRIDLASLQDLVKRTVDMILKNDNGNMQKEDRLIVESCMDLWSHLLKGTSKDKGPASL